MAIFRKKQKKEHTSQLDMLDPGRMPRHVAIIMDGNGRWAEQRGMPRLFGHRAAMEAVRNIVRASSDWGIQVLSLYAFSTENWSRPHEEVQGLMDLLVEFLNKELEQLHQENVLIRMMGDMSRLPDGVRTAITEAFVKTANNTGLILNLGLNYGGRQELLHAVQDLLNTHDGTPLSHEAIESRLYTAGLPDPDLVIRTSGEQRISNFMLYQIAYAEFVFCQEYWPGFTTEHYKQALLEYQHRDRRFGGTIS